jgi:hypothetical protein
MDRLNNLSFNYVILQKFACPKSVLQNRFFNIPDPNFSIPDPGSKRFRIADPHQRILVCLTLKIVSKLSKILSVTFISVPDFFPIPDTDPGVKKAADSEVKKAPDPGSSTLPKMNVHNFSLLFTIQSRRQKVM